MPIDREGDGPPLRKAETKPEADTGLRVTPFTDDVFDDEYYRGRGRATGGSPLGLIVGVVFGAAIAGGAAWFALKDQGLNGIAGSDGGVPVVKADQSPYKIKPETPGGMQVENQDKTVYDRVAKTDVPNRVENLLPPPEQPKTPPKAEPKPAPKSAEPPLEVKSPLDEKRDELAAMIANLEKKGPEGEKTVIEEPPALPKAAMPKPEPASPPKPQVPMPPRDPNTEQAAAVPSATTPSGPGLLVQLAAAKSEEGAMAEWNRIKTKHGTLVGELSPTVIRADLGERGVFFRLRAGMLPDKAAADALCAALTAEGNACLVVKP
jgi:SPOR domain